MTMISSDFSVFSQFLGIGDFELEKGIIEIGLESNPVRPGSRSFENRITEMDVNQSVMSWPRPLRVEMMFSAGVIRRSSSSMR